MTAKAMPKTNNKVVNNDPRFKYDNGDGVIYDTKGHEFFYGDHFCNTFCCGMVEKGEFDFVGKQPTYCTSLQEAFNEYIQTGKYAFAHLTITRPVGERITHQPKWFMDCLKNYPGASYSGWRKNPNSGNEIQVWLLPV